MKTMRVGALAADIGVGLAAGAAGTAAMTLSSSLEMKFRRRSGSSAPAQAVGKVLGVEPRGETERVRFATMAHWGYGTAWGAVRGVLAWLRLPPPAATAAHLGLVWSTELIMLPALGVAPPATQWGRSEVAIDAWHHSVYAAATSAAYQLLDHNR
ncbi:hypothetical protein [Streptomyces gobiensis]|uniref:hypothetical protein n=1 Tax=Streptomyces gobiensis TaxID=2875706 RepID=UPI001E391185|nr:hypothetical protein [Streptomyces gobiensis]UGY91254.1 hypothetical protein test1122_05665 [Streptomyces gobiensis]